MSIAQKKMLHPTSSSSPEELKGSRGVGPYKAMEKFLEPPELWPAVARRLQRPAAPATLAVQQPAAWLSSSSC